MLFFYSLGIAGRGRDDYARMEAKRKERERPTRTLFIRNIKYDVSEEEIRTAFAPFGELKSIFNLTNKRGLCFVSFVSTTHSLRYFRSFLFRVPCLGDINCDVFLASREFNLAINSVNE